MFTVHPDVQYKDASPEQKAFVKDSIQKDLKAALDKDLPSFRLSIYNSFYSSELKCCVFFPHSLYLDVCRETIKGPFCFQYKGFLKYEVTLVQNALKLDNGASFVAVPPQ